MNYKEIKEIEEFMKCRGDMKYFIEKYCKISTPDRAYPTNIVLNEYQNKLLYAHILGRVIYTSPDRQVGNTTILLCIALHTMIFGDNRDILFMSMNHNMSNHSNYTFRNIYDGLPELFKQNLNHVIKDW